ncbi:MAG: bifunctional adenosylcobinamide kinase/adenosylcobinamide-phosphate guanylyltransferase [Erythrobacter sp.]|uniref:bifunctional adenosylcobinamide kinase/adenosylcobinamide-phosphate guanylyltransferase n=1 Tax=Erythrobacter sp. TaxID=1042 RepID=UPI00262FF249|nr:bifunctional adenosylcobinamide kinase/adenosylcobinamide-phosphate guanylyltransferase [Erythrobacter sp.]MDJ0977276.1 bifunctional adenosylcobinamide kinase/adenosylcobinamide-phosphate guanylyltransferase [Erythrobacter sp.]
MERMSLFLGGARSGKSRLALASAEALPGPHIFVATAQPFDYEMRERIDKHRQERDDRWRTIEAPLELASAVKEAGCSSVVIDCCTLWLSNVMLAERDVGDEVKKLLSVLQSSSGKIVLVSNEVGSGIVPDNKLGRDFRDEQGRLNQKLAALSDRVDLVVAGLPLRIKG